MTIDHSRDHEVWDNVETIVYFAKSQEKPPTTGASVTKTLWLLIRKDFLPGDSLLIGMDMTVDLPVLTLGGIVPKADDIMQRANGSRWIIKLVEVVAVENEYRVHCIRSHKGA